MTHSLVPGGNLLYLGLVLVTLFASLFWWSRRFRSDPRLVQIFAAAVVGAFVGAKLGFLVAEAWLSLDLPLFWKQLAGGKTILGALLGGFFGVEAIKRVIGYRQPTGDSFALVVPLGVALGRVGCLAHGCCQGVVISGEGEEPFRWPAPAAEIGFNLAFFVVAWFLGRYQKLPGQHFHLYLISYGVFRFFHEFVRDTPAVVGTLSGYQFLAILVALTGVIGFLRRRANCNAEKIVGEKSAKI